jgi:hypothetical protein
MEIRNISSQNQATGGRIVNNGSMAGNVPVTRAVSSSMLANMEKGTVFSGDIIDVRNSFIKILLDGNQTITAKAGDNSNLNIGDYIRFMIKDNTGDQILIKALNVDNSHTNPLIMALKSANIPVTEDNMNMISEMMRNEMPIDANSVNEMYKNISMFEKSNPKTIVNLVRHEIPLNETNIAGYEKYINYEHRLNYELSSIVDDIPKALDSVSQKDASAAKNIFNEIINNLPDFVEVQGNIDIAADENIFKFINDKAGIVLPDKSLSNEVVTDNSIGVDLSNEAVTDNSVGVDNSAAETSANELLENTALNGNNIPNKEFLLKLSNDLNDNQFSALLKNEKVLKYIKAGILKEFSIDVNKLNSNGEEFKDNIKTLYEKLENKIRQLEADFKNYPKEAANLLEKTNGLKQNLSFMNEINQMASYVQLPLKFSESTNHGDLYVYNKNHGKLADKEVLTAFMHLDMDNLGATDVDIKLENERLSTNFSLADDLSAKIVEEHLSELKERLTLAGYNVSINVKTEKTTEEENPFEKVLEIDRPKMSIKRFSFDVRA